MKIVTVAIKIQAPSLGAIDRKGSYTIEH
jgi:hypothetical protein